VVIVNPRKALLTWIKNPQCNLPWDLAFWVANLCPLEIRGIKLPVGFFRNSGFSKGGRKINFFGAFLGPRKSPGREFRPGQLNWFFCTPRGLGERVPLRLGI